MRRSAPVLLGLLLLSVIPQVYAPSEEQTMQQFLPRAQNLLSPIAKFLSGSSALAVSGFDPRMRVSKEEALNEFASQSGSPILQSAAAAALIPYRSPTQKFSRNILLTRDFGQFPFQTEPTLAVNPKNPDHIVVGVIDYNSPNVVSYVSIDRGSTWEGPFQPRYLEKDIGAAGDPAVAFDRNGNVYVSSISIGVEEFNFGGTPFEVLVSSISVSKSSDGGLSWGKPVDSTIGRRKPEVQINPAVKEGVGGFIAINFLDKPWMVVGPSQSDPSRDSVFVTYTRFVIRFDIVFILGGQLFYFANPVLETSIELAKSDDGGQTWSPPVAVSPTVRRLFTGETAQQRRVLQGSQTAVARDGTVYVAWFDSTADGTFEGLGEIRAARSDDGAKTFSVPLLAADVFEPQFSPRNADFRGWASAFPQIAVGPKGDVSIVYVARPNPAERPTDDGDVFFITSVDKGNTWSRPKRVNDDVETRTEKDRYQFFPALDYDPKGNIHVMWGDFRDDRTEKTYNIYYTRSEDGGKTWAENARVTDFPSNPNRAFPRGLFIGDYFALKATEADVFMVWADSRLGEFGTLNQKIGFARISPMLSPSIFVSPPRGPGGRDVQIQGFDFQPDMEIFVEISGAIVTGSRTDKDGRFSIKLFMPIAGEGAQQVRIIDATGNVASASFLMDVGFNTINEQLDRALQELATLRKPLLSGTSNSTSVEQLQTQLSSVTALLWTVTGLSVAGVLIAATSLVLTLRRIRALR